MAQLSKVIFIGHRHYDAWFPPFGEDAWYLAGGHTGFIATHLKHFAPDVAIESWRPDATVTHYTERTIQGVVCRVFPSRYVRPLGDVSVSLLHLLRQCVGHSDDLVIHYGGITSIQFYYILAAYASANRIVGNHLGETLRAKRHTLRSLPTRFLERHILPRTHHFLCAGRTIAVELSKLGVKPEAMSFPEIGVDLAAFRPLDQAAARREIGLDTNKPLILYIGRADATKGLPELLEAMPAVASKTGAGLISVGCLEGDVYYKRVQEMSIRNWHQVPHHILPFFHNACDVLVRPAGIDRGPVSVGVNVIESMACGTPVVSPTLTELPTYSRYQDIVGTPPGDNLADSIARVLKDGKRHRATSCREMVAPYSWPVWLGNLLAVYQGSTQRNLQ